MRVILGSSSPRRREIFGSLGLPFEIIKPDIDETQHADESPFVYVARVSRQKADAILAQIQGDSALVLTADTIVVSADTMGIDVQGELLGKPADAQEAFAMLDKLRNKAHLVCTQIHLVRLNTDGSRQAVSQLTQTRVIMRDYSDDEIRAYIATGDPFDKAGGYAIQHETFRPVSQIDGCYQNVVGLPLCAVKRALVALDVPNITAPATCDCPKY